MDMTTLFDLSYGVYAVTTWDEGRAVGCIANSAMQITAEPATIAVSINKDNYTHGCILNAGKFALSVLTEKCDPKVIGNFGFRSARDAGFDKFEGVPQKIVNYLPAVAGASVCITAKLIAHYDCGTHTIFVGEVTDGVRFSKDPPMTYAYYHKVVKGKSPKNAPTYQAEQPKEETKMEAKYVCTVCGYVYDGDTPFEELPDDYVCPLCGVGKDQFEKQEG